MNNISKIFNQKARLLIEFIPYVLKRFVKDDGPESAGFLCYTSLLAMVPLIAVGLAALSAFPVFDRWSVEIQTFVFQNFVPAAGEVIQKYMMEFVSKASRLSITGIIFLMVTAILLMTNIERSLNRIWRVHRQRSWRSRFLVYWAALTLGPMLIGASLGVSSYMLSLPYVSDAYVEMGGRNSLLRIAPIFTSTLAFSLLYVLVPNRQVNWRHALTGGVVAAILLELAKAGFAAYVKSFPTYDKIYGALAAIPVFLVWVYLSWVITLLGASLAAALGEPWDRSRRRFTSEPELIQSLRVIKVIADDRKLKTTGLGDSQLYKALNTAHVVDAHEVVAKLIDTNVLGKDESGTWVLLKGLQDLSLNELAHKSCQNLIHWHSETDEDWLKPLEEQLSSGTAVLKETLDYSVDSIINAALKNGKSAD